MFTLSSIARPRHVIHGVTATVAMLVAAQTVAFAQTSGHNPFAPLVKTASAASASLAPSESTAARPVPAAGSTTIEHGLYEERTFLTVPGRSGFYRLEALIVRPVRASGRLPIALITHGKNATSAENMQIHAVSMLPQARDLAMRGWLAVVVIRRGYGDSDGIPGVPASSAYMACANSDLVRGFDVEAEDLAAALKVVALRSDADGSRAIAMGQSYGGGAVLALAARAPKGLLGVVNMSGGVWRSSGGQQCGEADLVKAMAAFGARTRIPTLWLYAQNDSLFPPALVTRMHGAYNAAGGHADLRKFPPVLYDGHRLFADFKGRVAWLRALDSFLQANDLPNANRARTDEVMAAANLFPRARQLVENYLSSPGQKFLAVTSSRKGAIWLANPNASDGARANLLTRCREKFGQECTVAMNGDEIVLPIVTGALEPQRAR
jgi:pimeloyl-ACP methyl ester carboxylesterase